LLGLALAGPASALTLSAVGDVLLWYGPMAGTLQSVSAAAHTPWDVSVYPFERVQPYLKGLVFGNLEGPLTAKPAHRYKPKWMRFYFKSPVNEAVAALKQGGFRVMSVANNHSMDSGARGLHESLAALQAGDIQAVGAGDDEAQARRPVTISSAQGGKVTFLAFCAVGPLGTFAGPHSPGAARADEDTILRSVKAALKPGIPVVVSLHWGIEQQRDLPVIEPQDEQRELARRIIDAGAVLVLGHHPHVVTRFEERGRGLIVYSLGNFLFSGARIKDRRRSVILHVDLDASGVHSWDLVPVWTDGPEHPFQPEPMPKAIGQAYLAKLLNGRYPHYQ
jgi:poly-gamma-glutamate synthesis protein (capsule biosynthesis protein)